LPEIISRVEAKETVALEFIGDASLIQRLDDAGRLLHVEVRIEQRLGLGSQRRA
jgi:hypothetical protein